MYAPRPHALRTLAACARDLTLLAQRAEGDFAQVVIVSVFGCADVTAVADMGLMGRTIFIVCSDHGDMDMEQQQFCERQAPPPFRSL